MVSKNPMTQLYSRLGSVGFPRRYIREIVLPDWWDDKIAHNPAGYAEGLMILSRNLGLDLSSMQNEAVPVGLRNLGPCKFKKTTKTKDEELALAGNLATRMVELIDAAVPKPKAPFPKSASEIRKVILSGGARWVGLANLVDYCWSVGLPVMPVTTFPPKAKKMEGLAVGRSGRYAAVLSKNVKHSAWLLFILAHELGHIIRRHISGNSVLVDEVVDRKSADEEEKAANAFALEVLTGNPELQVFPVPVGHRASAQGLARAARQAGTHERIDPGHIILNCAYQTGGNFFAVANAALKLLEPSGDAVALIHSRMTVHLDKSKLPEDTYEFILRVSKARAMQ